MKQRITRILAFLLCLALLLSLVTAAFADFGDFGGDDDWGGDDGGWGGDDGGWGGDDGGWGGWDDDDDDDDWGWSSSSSSTRSGPASNAEFIFMVIIIIIAIIVALVKKLNEYSERKSRYRKAYSTRQAHPPVASTLPDLKPMTEYRKLDPEFDESKLKQKLSNLFIQMQQCWQKKDIEALRPYFTDAYYSQLELQLEPYRKARITNVIERPVVLSITFNGFNQAAGNDHIYLTLQARMVDYQISDTNGKLIRGSKTSEKFMTYRYHLTRPSGQHSSSLGGVKSLSCPHCGAPLSINESARCPYCDSVITVDRYDFVIAQIEGISQRTI